MAKSKKCKFNMDKTSRNISAKVYDEQIIAFHGTEEDINHVNFITDEMIGHLDELYVLYKDNLDKEPKDRTWEDKYLIKEYEGKCKVVKDEAYAQIQVIGDKYLDVFKAHIQSADPAIKIYAIMHDKDTQGDNFFEPSLERRHFHILGKTTASPNKFRTWCNIFGILYRADYDSELCKNHGLEPIASWSDMCLYLIHGTPQAIADAKYQYPSEDIISNQTLETYNADAQVWFSSQVKRSDDEIADLDSYFYDLGYKLQPFEDSYGKLSSKLRQNRSIRSLLNESYYRGVSQNIQDEKHVDRICIFIEGESNMSKSYSSLVACQHFGKTYVVDGGKTGKFDGYDVSTRCLILNDYYLYNLLNIADNNKVQLYKRNSGNPYLCGDIVVVTSNKPFNQWLLDCGVDDKEQRLAMMTRFFQVKMIERPEGGFEGRVVAIPKTFRGDGNALVDKFLEWIKVFNESAASYKRVDSVGITYDRREALDKLMMPPVDLAQVSQEYKLFAL